MKYYFILFALSFFTLFSNAQTEISFCYMGSSSFAAELAEATKIIAEASGDFQVTYENKGGYFRHDYFAQDSMLYVNWVNDRMQDILAQNYDFVIMQAFNYQILNPAEHDFLFEWLLPDMVQQLESNGAEVIFYHKFGGVGCYPNPLAAKHFFEVEACMHSEVSKNTLAEGAAQEVLEIPYFSNLGFLTNGGGHPGCMQNYMTACLLSYLMTGVDPRGNTARSFPLQSWAYDAWVDLDESDPRKDRVVDGNLILTEWEADTLQRMTMRWHLPWSQLLQDALSDQQVFQEILDTILILESGYAQYREWSDYDEGLMDRLDDYCDQNLTGFISSEKIQALRDTAKMWSDRIQTTVELYFSFEEIELLKQDYLNYWEENNTKFRDDVYFKSLLALEIARQEGYTDEVTRLTSENQMFIEVLSQAAENMLLQRLSPAERTEYLTSYTWDSPLSDYSPNYGAIQLDSIDNWQQLIIMREIYFEIWEDVNLEDELRDNDFPQSVWHKADSIFVVRWNELLSLNATGTYLLVVHNGTGGGYYSSTENVALYSNLPAFGYMFDTWIGDSVYLIDPLALATTLTMPATNICLTATYKNAISIEGNNFSFETPDIATYEYDPAGSLWSYSVQNGDNGAGISDNEGLPWTDDVFVAPDGEQMCYLKGLSWISQDIDFPEADYQLTVKAVQRPRYQDATQTFVVKIGTQTIGTFTPTTNDVFLTYTSDVFSTSGTQTLTIEGTNPLGGLNTVIIDDIQINSIVVNETNPPTVPGNLTAADITYKSFTLSWDPATDDVGVISYEIYKNGIKTGETPNTSFEITNLSPSTTYTMTVKAKDAARNVSAASVALDVTTAAATALYKLTVHSGSGDGNYEENEEVNIVADITTGKEFLQWTGDVIHVDDVNSSATSVTMPASDVNITATYADLTFTITFNVNDGTDPIQGAAVTLNSETINTDASGLAVFNDMIYGNAQDYSISKAGYNTVNSSINVTANKTENVILNEIVSYSVTINNGTGSGDYEEGATVNITANSPPSDQVFDQWTGDVHLLSSASATTTSFTMPASTVSLTATYKNKPNPTYAAMITDGSGSGSYEEGALVNISANPAPSGKEFDQWTGDIQLLSSVTVTAASFTMPANTVQLTATYKDLPVTYKVVIYNGSGSGEYQEGEIVNISASIPASGKVFEGWIGDTLVLSSASDATTSFTMPANTISLTAKYTDIVNTISNNATSRLILYPNPANEWINIISEKEPYSLAILDVSGKKVMEVTISGQKGQVNISHLNSGTYFIDIRYSDNSQSLTRLVKQ